MEYIISLAIISVECIAELNVGLAFFKYKTYDAKKIWGACILYIVSTFVFMNFFIPDYTIVKSIASIFFITVLFSALLYGDIIFKILIATFSLGLNYRIEYFFLFLLSSIFQYDFEKIYSGISTFVICAILQKSIFFVVAYFIRKIRERSVKEIKLDIKEYLTILVFSLSNILIIVLLFNIEYSNRGNSYVNVFISFFVIIINMIILYFFDKLEKERQIRQDNIILQQRIDGEMNSINLFKKMYDDQRKKTHDFKNHLLTIKDLAYNPEELVKYMNDLIAENSQSTYAVNTNNSIIDAILNQKLISAYKEGISVKFELDDLSNIAIENKDIVVLLANALDNAIEACMKMDDRYIKIKIKDNNFSTLFSIINSSPYVDVKPDGTILTTKRDVESHGYGLKNIKSVVEKYNGIMLAEYNNKQFQFTVSIDKKNII